ncbi:hypothetical protein ASF45_24655 [Pseudorhodoferax sp. Leaf265]|nr:hypothetical protein ASF45_24655 [Pseudorhodoferax sp. Leaf265]
MAGLHIVPVSYRGSGPALTDLLGRQVDMMIELGPQAIPYIKAGKLRVLASTTKKRTDAMPDVPTLDESGVPGFEASTWFALYAPAGTPPHIVAKLHSEMSRIFSTSELKARMATVGAEVAITSAQELVTFQASETKKWTAVIDKAGIQPE